MNATTSPSTTSTARPGGEQQTLAPYSLPDLPYAPDVFDGIIGEETMHLHHHKHHAAYVKGANAALEKLAALPAGEDPSGLVDALSFNVSGHVLHSLFWTSITPTSSAMSPALAAAVASSFGSEDAMRTRLVDTVSMMAGSGWAALTWEPVGQRLLISQIHDHHLRHVPGTSPLLVIDAWEHAYYLDYRNDKHQWAERFLDIADWTSASQRFDELTTA